MLNSNNNTNHLKQTLNQWIRALDNYDEHTFFMKPSTGCWSIGQVYVHLVSETNFFLSQVRLCLSTNKNANKSASSQGLEMLANNDFPDERIEGPPSNLHLNQPSGKRQIEEALHRLSHDIEEVHNLIGQGSSRGKSRHPGLKYLNAHQWYQFAEMHLRHHFRQKQRIDDFLILNAR